MTVEKKTVPKELLDSLLADYRKPEDLIGENGSLASRMNVVPRKLLIVPDRSILAEKCFDYP